MTGTIRNGMIWIKLNYTIPEPTASEIDYYTKDGELSLEVTER